VEKEKGMTVFGNRTQWVRLAVGLVGSVAAAMAVMTVVAPVTGHARADLVTICHLSGNANDIWMAPAVPGVTPPAAWIFGQLMDVNENAVGAHVEHGDSATPHPSTFRPFLRGTYWTVAELFALPNFGDDWMNVIEQGQYPNADCAVRYPIY
jgi:hypothetical protein